MNNDKSPISNFQWKIFVRKIFLLPVYFYRVFISPLTPPSCRYTPTCSQYMVEAVLKYGISKAAGSASSESAVAIHGEEAAMIRCLNSVP